MKLFRAQTSIVRSSQRCVNFCLPPSTLPPQCMLKKINRRMGFSVAHTFPKRREHNIAFDSDSSSVLNYSNFPTKSNSKLWPHIQSLSPDAIKSIERGDSLANQGKLTEAMALFNQVMEMYPDHPQPVSRKADMLAQLGEFGEALPLYQRVIYLLPQSVPALVSLGYCQFKSGQIEEAKHSFSNAIYLDKSFLRTYIHIAEIKLAEGKVEEAIQFYEDVIRQDDKYLAAYIGLGQYYVTISHPEKGKPYLLKALELDPDNTEALVGLCVFSYVERRFNESVSYASRGINSTRAKTKEGLSDLYVKRALSLSEMGKPKDGLPDADMAVRTWPENWFAHLIRGSGYADAKEYQKAILDFDYFVAHDPQRIDISKLPSEQVIQHRYMLHTVCVNRAECHRKLLEKEYPWIKMHANNFQESGDTLVKPDWIEDLNNRVKVSKQKRLHSIFADLCLARSQFPEAKLTVDPILIEFKSIVNSYLDKT